MDTVLSTLYLYSHLNLIETLEDTHSLHPHLIDAGTETQRALRYLFKVTQLIGRQ